MTELERKALLPAGLRDILPPDAAFEADLIERLIACFAESGYQRVKPPLVEFEDGLLNSAGGDLSRETFRLMDPVSQRMMGVRPDITPQIARIAGTRLRNEPRPLRLSYAGEVLRVRGTQLRPERQFAQVGAELVGATGAAADAEIVLLATAALARVGVEAMSVDLTIPPLVPALCDGMGVSLGDRTALRRALDRKDIDAVRQAGGAAAETLCSLLEAAGPAAACLTLLRGLKLPPAAAGERDRVEAVIALLTDAAPGLKLTLDPVENRGFEYHTGVSFSIFAPGVRGELGGGGRYVAAANGTEAGDEIPGEPATGFTLYVDTIMRCVPGPAEERRLYLPADTPAATASGLREKGWITVAGLEPERDNDAAAKRLKCTHVLADGNVCPVEGK